MLGHNIGTYVSNEFPTADCQRLLMCKKIVLEIEFICLDKELINKVKKLFNECKININKIVSYDYAKKFLISDRDDTMCICANKVLNGVNQSEVYLAEANQKKTSLFNKIFGLFD